MHFPLQFPNGDQIKKSKKKHIIGMNKRSNDESRQEIVGWG
jgi:hypothetical protein